MRDPVAVKADIGHYARQLESRLRPIRLYRNIFDTKLREAMDAVDNCMLIDQWSTLKNQHRNVITLLRVVDCTHNTLVAERRGDEEFFLRNLHKRRRVLLADRPLVIHITEVNDNNIVHLEILT